MSQTVDEQSPIASSLSSTDLSRIALMAAGSWIESIRASVTSSADKDSVSMD